MLEAAESAATNGVEYWSAATGLLAAVLLVLILTDSLARSPMLADSLTRSFARHRIRVVHAVTYWFTLGYVAVGLIVTLNAIAADWGPPPVFVTVLGVVYAICPLVALSVVNRMSTQESEDPRRPGSEGT